LIGHLQGWPGGEFDELCRIDQTDTTSKWALSLTIVLFMIALKHLLLEPVQ
jgi:hypothetical protein